MKLKRTINHSHGKTIPSGTFFIVCSFPRFERHTVKKTTDDSGKSLRRTRDKMSDIKYENRAHPKRDVVR